MIQDNAPARAPSSREIDSARNGTDSKGSVTHPSDHDPRFVSYYEELSVNPRTLARFESIQKAILRVLGPGAAATTLDVADIGCNTGMQCHIWAKLGHRVRGLDISDALLQVARRRASEAGLPIVFELGSATNLPWPDASVDVCIAPELLEHVADWESCVNEFARVLRPGGVLYLTTTNVLCPRQEEFTLPFYSWYPAPAKRYCERLAVTTHPEIVNYASYPAVHWFSFYGLRRYLRRLGLSSMDRFDVIDINDKRGAVRLALQAIRAMPPLRLLAHMTQGGTMIVAVKRI